MNIVSLSEFKMKKEVDQYIENLNVRICTYNFLKKLNITSLRQLQNIEWATFVHTEKKAALIVEDLTKYLSAIRTA